MNVKGTHAASWGPSQPPYPDLMPTPFAHRHSRGSTLVLSLLCVTGLAIAAALTLQRITPRFQQASQAAAWQEARLAAESGIDVALVELEQNAIGFNDGTWTGWSQYSQASAAPTLSSAGASLLATLPASASGGTSSSGTSGSGTGSSGGGTGLVGSVLGTVGSLLGGGSSGPGNGAGNGQGNAYGQSAYKAAQLAKKSGVVIPAIPQTLSLTKSLLALLGNPVAVSPPIFLDNLQSASAGNRPTNVDVQLWAVYPTPNPYTRWYRLRSVATVALPPLATRTQDRLENDFRRFSLRHVREQLTYDDMGKPTNVPTPSTTRTTEVLVEPVLPFELAILTDQSLSLATSGVWAVDSYDSSNPNKSVLNGQYPGRLSPLAQANGNIATNAVRPANSPYGPVIAANGTLVRGAVATNGADDPATPVPESISGASKIDPTRVRSDFYRELRPLSRPTTGIFRLPPPPGQPFVAGSPSQPAFYLITKDLHEFSVVPPPLGGAGATVIMVNGDLSIPDGTISIAPNVQAQLFVAGNIDLFNRPINVGGLPAQLQIYGEDSQGAPRTLRAFGNASVTAAFYGPSYDVHLADNVEWFGAVAARSFEMLGGGTGGFHYDESLAIVGAPIGFRIARYVEDVRE